MIIKCCSDGQSAGARRELGEMRRERLYTGFGGNGAAQVTGPGAIGKSKDLSRDDDRQESLPRCLVAVPLGRQHEVRGMLSNHDIPTSTKTEMRLQQRASAHRSQP